MQKSRLNLLASLAVMAGNAAAQIPVDALNAPVSFSATKRKNNKAKASRTHAPFKPPTDWEIRNRVQKAKLYADTPRHGPTRQQRRAQGKAWRTSPARAAV